MTTPRVNIAINSHPILLIQDQLDFLSNALDDAELSYQISRSLSREMLNIVIEGFTPFSSEYIANFCKENKAKIALVMTEHFEVTHTITLNETAFLSKNEYMPNAIERFEALCNLLPHIQYFITLGHLPMSENIAHIFPSTPVIEIPYPEIPSKPRASQKIDYDFIFQGATTNYRNTILDRIKSKPSSVLVAFKEAENQRLFNLSRSRFALNIPQHENWRYISPMRCLYSLRNGVVTLNISSYTIGAFDDIFPIIHPTDIESLLFKYLRLEYDKLYESVLEKYNDYRKHQHPSQFPLLMKLWADLELNA